MVLHSPNGGMRSTDKAAAHTSWDVSSPPFYRNDTLYIPTAFIAWSGESLDLKTPLLRSGEAINLEALRILKHLGDKKTRKVVTNCGWEQEFFVIDRKHYLNRPDIIHCGRTLFGALPSKGQQTDGHYFGLMPLRVRDFLRDVESELWQLGISVNCVHNEVAPAQHEISPIFTLSNMASDSNQVAMEVLQEVSHRHGLTVLFHEKPFKGLNGSGKHNNWGLNTSDGTNLFVPGDTKGEQIRFITFVAALTRTLDLHGDVIRIGVAHAGNDHRLGSQEAPPSMIGAPFFSILF
jgi:glutamine synthetase